MWFVAAAPEVPAPDGFELTPVPESEGAVPEGEDPDPLGGRAVGVEELAVADPSVDLVELAVGDAPALLMKAEVWSFIPKPALSINVLQNRC